MADSLRAPVFLHAMWRTGSSYLQSRFEEDPSRLCFYEPFNGEIGSARKRALAARDYATKRDALRHPAVEGGYFGRYEQADPASGLPLWRLAHPRLPLHDVYNGLSPQGLALLQGCQRLAARQGRQPVFGFCHSGLQIEAMRQALGGLHLYLWRDSRDQFYSYGPRDNDFFCAATALQLLASARLRPLALQLVPWLGQGWPGALLQPALVREAPHWLSMRAGRALWRRLSLAEAYLLFHLSWRVANEAGAQACELRCSLQQLQQDAALRDRLARRLGIQFPDLRYRPNPVDTLGLDFAALEQRVSQVLAEAPARPVRQPQAAA